MNWPALLTLEKAAQYLDVSESTISRLKAAGHLRTVAFKMPGSKKPVVRYRLSDLDEFVSGLKYGEGSFSGSK